MRLGSGIQSFLRAAALHNDSLVAALEESSGLHGFSAVGILLRSFLGEAVIRVRRVVAVAMASIHGRTESSMAPFRGLAVGWMGLAVLEVVREDIGTPRLEIAVSMDFLAMLVKVVRVDICQEWLSGAVFI